MTARCKGKRALRQPVPLCSVACRRYVVRQDIGERVVWIEPAAYRAPSGVWQCPNLLDSSDLWRGVRGEDV